MNQSQCILSLFSICSELRGYGILTVVGGSDNPNFQKGRVDDSIRPYIDRLL